MNIRDAIHKDVVRSGVLGQSDHQIALFNYLLKNSFCDAPKPLKGYIIALDVFNRQTNFDSSQDSIVRVEMFRLRANLALFNANNPTYKLLLKKSSYLIQYLDLEDKEPSSLLNLDSSSQETVYAPTLVDQSLSKASILTKLKTFFSHPGKSAGLASIITGIFFFALPSVYSTNSTIDRFHACSNTKPNLTISLTDNPSSFETHLKDILFLSSSQHTHINSILETTNCRGAGTPSYELRVASFENGDDINVKLKLMSLSNQRLLISGGFSAKLSPKFDQVSASHLSKDPFLNIVRISNDWLKQSSILHKNALVSDWESDLDKTRYSCLSQLYDSFISDSNQSYIVALNCLVKSQTTSSEDLTHLGALAASYLEQAQNLRENTVSDPLLKAETILRAMDETWIESVEATVAKIMYESIRPDFNAQRLQNILLKAEKTYHSNPSVLLEVAKYYGFRLGDWDKAHTISSTAYRLQSGRDNSVYLIAAMHRALSEDKDNMMTQCKRAYSENSIMANLVVNFCARQVNDEKWAERTQRNLDKYELGSQDQKVDFIKGLKFEVGLEELLKAS